MATVPAVAKVISGPSARKAYVSRNVERAGVWLWNNYLHKVEIGLLPKGYDFKIHGPYCPWRWYGKPEVALKNVKLGELPAYLARREKSVGAVAREMGRQWHYWQFRFARARYNNMNTIYQTAALWTIIFAVLTLDRQFMHRQYRYHW